MSIARRVSSFEDRKKRFNTRVKQGISGNEVVASSCYSQRPLYEITFTEQEGVCLIAWVQANRTVVGSFLRT